MGHYECRKCDQRYDQCTCARRARTLTPENTLATLISQRDQAIAERDRLRQAIWAVIDVFDAAVHNHESRGKGGQHVSYHGDFASMPPSSASRMKRWSRDLRDALAYRWPMTREEFQAAYGGDEKTLDELFKERKP